MTRLERALGGMALVALAGNAHAQAPDDQPSSDACAGSDSSEACPEPAPPPAPPPATAVEPAAPPAPAPPGPVLTLEPRAKSSWLHGAGLALSVGGGVEDFSNTTMRDTTGMAGSWNARVTLGTRRYLAVEGSYIGSAQSIARLGLPGSSATLWGNGVQGALRINMFTDRAIQPFVFGGAAYRFYSLSFSGANASDVANNANVVEVPAGVGAAIYFHSFIIDVRGEYRWAWGDTLISGLSGIGGTGNGLDRWGASADIGFEF